MTDLFFDILDIEDERKENLKDDFLFFFLRTFLCIMVPFTKEKTTGREDLEDMGQKTSFMNMLSQIDLLDIQIEMSIEQIQVQVWNSGDWP